MKLQKVIRKIFIRIKMSWIRNTGPCLSSLSGKGKTMTHEVGKNVCYLHNIRNLLRKGTLDVINIVAGPTRVYDYKIMKPHYITFPYHEHERTKKYMQYCFIPV
jgi:hypothetical protein